MKTEKTSRTSRDTSDEIEKGTITSMIFSLFLVGLSVLFVFGFHQYLKTHNYNKTGETNSDEILTLDKSFRPTYIIICDVSSDEVCSTDLPGEVTEESKRYESSELVRVVKRGVYKGKMYYQLQNGQYMEVKPMSMQELDEYIPLEGYIAITYISSSGVNIRRWVDFEADNIVRTVYIGDRVDVTAMVVTKTGKSAFRTDDGFYITTDSSYFSDYTNLRDKMGTPEEATTEVLETEDYNPME